MARSHGKSGASARRTSTAASRGVLRLCFPANRVEQNPTVPTAPGRHEQPRCCVSWRRALRNTAVSHDAWRRHDPDLVEQSTLPVRTCGRRSFPDRPWHVSRYQPRYERPHRRREPDAAHSAPARRNLAVYTNRPRLFEKLWAIAGVRRHQTGDTEMRAVFAPEALAQLAGVINAPRKRTLAPEEARRRGFKPTHRASSGP